MLEVCDFATSVGPVHSTTVLPVKSDSDFITKLSGTYIR